MRIKREKINKAEFPVVRREFESFTDFHVFIIVLSEPFYVYPLFSLGGLFCIFSSLYTTEKLVLE
jgi:hypothetical protein